MNRVNYKRRVFTMIREFSNHGSLTNVSVDPSDGFLFFSFTFRNRYFSVMVKSFKDLFHWLCGFDCCFDLFSDYDY